MSRILLSFIASFLTIAMPSFTQADELDHERDILVTFENRDARSTTTSVPYRARKRYSISAEAKRFSSGIASEFDLREIDQWPIRSLSVYCIVYRIPENADRASIVDRLRADERVESVQELNMFEVGSSPVPEYDDTYANLQHGIKALNLTGAHQHSRGEGVLVGVIDGNADTGHEDISGRIKTIDDFLPDGALTDQDHGTAVTSIIVARANNAKGIVGVAPDAELALYVACWSDPNYDTAICDSFSLAKALDRLIEKPPDVLNLSLAGPADPLLERLLKATHQKGVVIVAASLDGNMRAFPASLDEVISVRAAPNSDVGGSITAPGKQILVATPGNDYDFRSGSSLAAAHVSGVVALMLAIAPDKEPASVREILEKSQSSAGENNSIVDACIALQLAENSFDCDSRQMVKTTF